MEKTNKIIYWIFTGLLTALMLMSASMYIFNYEEVCKIFNALGYPSYIVIPLAIAKLLGLVAILTRKSKILLQLAYAGFIIDILLAFIAHYAIGDSVLITIIAMALVIGSAVMGNLVFKKSK